MTVWSNLFLVLDIRQIFKKVCLVLLTVVITTALFLVNPVSAAPSTDKTINFSARLKNNQGNIVADGFYNIRFQIYNQANQGTPLWSEVHYDTNGLATGQDNRIRVANGYLSARLGSINTFGSSINWDSDLWLTLDIGGTAQSAEIVSLPWDGEMNPRIQLSAVPYAISAGSVGGKTANQLIQLGQGVQTDSSNGTSSIFINKTGTGNLIELQSAGVNTFTLDNNGSITLGSTSNQSISIADSHTGSGQNLTISAGSSADTTSGDGGDLKLNGGSGSGENADGGNVSIDSGLSTGTGEKGSISIGTVNAGSITIGNTSSTTTIGGDLQLDNLDTTEQSATLNIGQNNASAIRLGQDTTIADGKTLTVGGDTTIKSSLSDSASALTVQNSAGDNQLSVDTLNSRVKIGSNDTVTTLMVLDSKATEGDPAGGTNGAMYYNSSEGKFRCYQAGSWIDCITPLPVSRVADEDSSNSTTTPIDVSKMEFNLSAKTKYHYKFVIIHEADDELNGVGFGVTTPDSPALSNWCINTTATLGSANGRWGSYCGVGDAISTTSGGEGVGTKFTSTLEGYIETGDDEGMLRLRLKSELNDKSTVKAGSFGILQMVK